MHTKITNHTNYKPKTKREKFEASFLCYLVQPIQPKPRGCAVYQKIHKKWHPQF